MDIDKSIYSHPAIKRSMERINNVFRNSGENHSLTLWLKVPWTPGQEPTTFTSEDRIIGCVAIYDPIDGQLL